MDSRGAVLSIDGAFLTTTTVLPDISTQNNTKVYQKGHKREFFIGNMTSGNSEVAYFGKCVEIIREGWFFQRVEKRKKMEKIGGGWRHAVFPFCSALMRGTNIVQ